MSKADAMVELALTLHTETDKAYLVSDDGERKNAKWVPRSQVTINTRRRSGAVEIIEAEMPEWLAADKRFI